MKKNLLAACALTSVLSAAGTVLICDHVFGLFGRSSVSENVIFSKLPSKVLKEEREVIVHLPESYTREPERRFPVIYVLDGSSQDFHTAHSAALMARIGVMPEVIVVGLPNVSGAGRQRDYTPPFMAQDLDDPKSPRGAADRFLAFLKTELLPQIESAYRTAPFRMLAGHSRGGLFVSYSLLADPQLFHARFAHSPALWRGNALLVTKLTELLNSSPQLEGFFYMSIGSEENEKMKSAYLQTRTALSQASVVGLRWHADLVAGADHNNNGELATPLGFKVLYKDWPTPTGAALARGR